MTQETTITSTLNASSATTQSEAVAAPKSEADREPTDEPMTGRARRIGDVVIIVVFLFAIGMPVLDMIFGLDQTPSSENRQLAPVPYAIKALGDDSKPFSERLSNAKQHISMLPRQIKEYTADHFGFRSFLIRQHGFFKFKLLGASSSPYVLLGKTDTGTDVDPGDQWLYFDRYKAVDHYRGTDLFTQAELEQWQAVLEKRQAWLAKQGIRYLVAIAPNKHTVYPEHLPTQINRVGEVSRTDQFIEHMRQHTDLAVIDTRPPLFESRKREPDLRLYFRTDTHWNQAGGFKAYQPIGKQLAAWYPAVKPLTWQDFTITYSEEAGGDLARLMGIPDQFREMHIHLNPKAPRQQLVPPARYDDNRLETESGRPDHPRLLMFRDSFGAALMPYLAQHASSATFIWTDQFVPELVAETKPDVVVTEMLERLLMRKPPPHDPNLNSNP